MKGAKNLEMEPDHLSEENIYANTCDFNVRRMRNTSTAKVIPATRSTKYQVILILGVLLILAFLVVVILVSLLFIDYKSTQKEILQMKNDSALKKGISDLQKSVANMTDDLNKIKLIKNKGPSYPLCSEGWNHYGLSCYYFSSDKKPWIASKKECEDKEAHLVVINSEEEMKFLRGFANKQTFWIGLTDADGTWKWVDGTPYDITPKFWGNTQPDNWKDPGVEESEDCATVRDGYDWNDLRCSTKIKYICEKKMTF